MRKPDFILIGAMKAGTTTLFRRLGENKGIDLPETKEPHFFSLDRNWRRGEEWYSALFSGCIGRTGEASTSYSDPATASTVARRIKEVVPETQILYALRDPVARMRSHYKHQVLRSRETRPFQDAVRDVDSEYVRYSLYGSVIQHYRVHFPDSQIFAFDIHELDSSPKLWADLLERINVPYATASQERHNATAEKVQFTPVMRWLWEQRLELPNATPRLLRRVAKRVLTRDAASSGLIKSTVEPVPDAVASRLLEDRALLSDAGIVASEQWGPHSK